MAEHYDLVVIGSGPAGEKGAAQAAYYGKKVALVASGGNVSPEQLVDVLSHGRPAAVS